MLMAALTVFLSPPGSMRVDAGTAAPSLSQRRAQPEPGLCRSARVSVPSASLFALTERRGLGFWLGRLARVGGLSAACDVPRPAVLSARRPASPAAALLSVGRPPARVRVLPRKHPAASPCRPSPLCPLPRPVDSVPGRVGSAPLLFASADCWRPSCSRSQAERPPHRALLALRAQKRL